MNPLKLTLTNFKGIKAGQGVDHITIELTVDGELLALAGKNGAGKTTVLDNLTPYRLMPSRASSYSTGSFSYFDHTYGLAKKVLFWEHDGIEYKSTILIKGTNKTKSQECYLNRVKADGTEVPVSLPDGTISDGKTKSYDALVEAILGTPEMFFTAAFSCQNRKSLDNYAAGEVKTLMGDMLGLEPLRTLSAEANDRAKHYRAQLDALRGRQGRAAEIEVEQADLRQRHEAAEGALQAAVTRKTLAKDTETQTAQRLLEARQDAASQAETIRRRETLTQQLAGVDARATAALSSLKSDCEERQDGIRHGIAQAKGEQQRNELQRNAAQRRIAEDTALLAEREAIEAAAARLVTIEAELTTARDALTAAEAEDAAYQATAQAVEAAAAALRVLDSEGKSMGAACQAAKDRAGLTDDVPCRGTDLQGRCQLLSEAMTAKAALPAQEQALEAKREERRIAHAKLTTEQTALGLMDRPDVKAARGTVAKLEQEARAASALAAKQSAITAAITRLADDQAAVETMTQAMAELEARIVEGAAKIAQIVTDYDNRRVAEQFEFDSERAALQAELCALPPTDAKALEAATAAAAQAIVELENAEQALDEARTRVTTIAARQEALTNELQALSADLAKAKTFEHEVAQWTLLSKALGNEGIIALSIDDAGPTLTSLANDILAECYGPRFSVALVTQEETRAGTLRETFDIVVYDAERDDRKSLADVSGGERVYLNEALTRAIALYLGQLSGRQYECLFSDEADGALDPEKKRQWARMMRAVLRLSGARRQLFITHSAEVRECADAVIDIAAMAA